MSKGRGWEKARIGGEMDAHYYTARCAARQAMIDDAGLPHYRRDHRGFAVSIGLPPSWTGDNSVTRLRRDSNLAIEIGMGFHGVSWLMRTGRGDDFISSTVMVTEEGAEVLKSAV